MSNHHGKKINNFTSFCGDLPKHKIYEYLPKSYKYFYDDEIRALVEQYYKLDIEKYGYKFEDFESE
jgi:hypothetical protein